jgi:hypothetical protein
VTAALGRNTRAELSTRRPTISCSPIWGTTTTGTPKERLSPTLFMPPWVTNAAAAQDVQLRDVGLHDEVGRSLAGSLQHPSEPVERTTWQSSPSSRRETVP